MDQIDKIMRKTRQFSKPALWLLAFFIACLLTFFSLFSFRFSFLVKPEEALVNLSTKWKKYLVTDTGFIEKNFVLINTAYDISLSKSPFLADSLVTTITDRKKLALLFRWLLENNGLYSAIVCDIRFEAASVDKPADDSLRKYIDLLLNDEKILFAGSFDTRHNQYETSFFKSINSQPLPGKPVHLGNTDYRFDDHNGFLEYALSDKDGEVRSIPLLLYERIYNASVETKFMGLIKLNSDNGNKLVWNDFVPEILYNNADFEKIIAFESTDGSNPNAAKVMLSSVNNMSEANPLYVLLSDTSKKKIVFIGSLGPEHKDKHNTIYGQTDGTAILVNIYHNIISGVNSFSFLFLFFLLTVFFLISINIVFHGFLSHSFYLISFWLSLIFIPKYLFDALGMIIPGFKIAAEDINKWVKQESHYFILLVTALFSNIFFNKVINIIVISFFVFILYKLFKYLYNAKKG